MYRFRGLPCSIRPDHELWAVVGQMRDGTGGGVLEWCTDEMDAHRIAREIRKDSQFCDVKVAAPETREAMTRRIIDDLLGVGEEA